MLKFAPPASSYEATRFDFRDESLRVHAFELRLVEYTLYQYDNQRCTGERVCPIGRSSGKPGAVFGESRSESRMCLASYHERYPSSGLDLVRAQRYSVSGDAERPRNLHQPDEWSRHNYRDRRQRLRPAGRNRTADLRTSRIRK